MLEDDGSEPEATGKRPPNMRARRERGRRKLARAEHVLPINMAIVGVQKAATSSLFRMLAGHPGIAGGPDKETRFFFDASQDWSDPDYSAYARPVRDADVRWAMDATPAYVFWPTALERMHSYDPGMRLILSVRDPIERAFSQWAMERKRYAGVLDLADAVERHGDRGLPPLGQQRYPADRMRHTSFFARGLYGEQLQRGLQWFPRDQWHVIEFRSLISDAEGTMDGITQFLDLPAFSAYPELKHNMSTAGDHTGAAPSPAAVRRLAERYAEDLRLFSDLSGLDVSPWPTSRVLDGSMSAEELTDRLVSKLGLGGAQGAGQSR